MAEAVITAAIDVTLSKAISIVENQISLQWDFKDEMNKLRDSLTMTRAFLRDAERRRVDDEPVQVWLKQLRKIAFEADDVLDELAYEDLRRKVENQKRKKVRNFFSISKNSIVFKLPQTVKGINISLNEINDRALKFGLQLRVQTLAPLSRGSQTTHSFVDSSQVVGREADVSKIIDLLIGSSTEQTFSIVSIVGMGGLGKTTLAKSVCNNERTKNYFNEIIWVCVSENFDVEKILEEVFVSVTGKTREGRSRNSILGEIKKKLEGKTYLLTLDDVWDEDFKTWEDLRGSLLGINENKRCRILVTTRNENVAVVRETSLENRYRPRILTEDESWAIIKSRAFHDSSVSPQLEDIGREIARKCGGVPLVANVIGGTMCNKWDIDEWVSLRDSSSWGSLENEGIVGILKLSYDRLPSPSLKQCFAYCSVFPKDFRIQKERLIQLWMAEGFLQQTRGKAFEDIGNEYFIYLLSNSLLQDVEKDWLGCIRGCKMHDLVHDLALSIRNSESSGTSHTKEQNVFDGMKLWHSLFLKSSLFNIEASFTDLRVLNFSDSDISSLSESIGRLKHLRYFDISNTHIDRLPKSITQLYLLQTLRLLSCNSLKELPKGMKNLVSLRHLYIKDRSHVPGEIGCLTSLQTLPIFDVGTKRGCGIGELRCLNELGGKLKISNLQNVRNKEQAQEAELWEKKKLHKLVLEWDYCWRVGNCSNQEEVLEGLEPHPKLKSLTIKNYNGENNPSWLLRKSNVGGPSASFQPINLVKLDLIRCENLKKLPTDLGLYPNLKFLTIQSLPNVMCMGKEFYFSNNSGDTNESMTLFPALEKFTLHGLKEVKEWVDVEPKIRVFPSLKELKISECDNLRSFPVMRRFSSLETLEIRSCDISLIGHGVFPSSLKELDIQCCRKLRSIPSVEGGISFLQNLFVSGCCELSKIEEGLLASTCLSDVWISNCPNLTSIPLNQGSESLLKLQLTNCDELREIEGGLSACKRLENLWIQDCPNLIPIPSIDGFLSLLDLRLEGCQGLTSLPSGLRTCTSLQELHFTRCQNLKSIPEETLGCLTRLKRLRLGPFSEELEEFPGLTSIHHLHSSLQNLTLFGWEKLSSLPHQLQHLTALKELWIGKFSGLKALPEWLGNLSSLQSLSIRQCENLGHLEALQQLSNLKKLWLGPFSEELEEFPDLSSIHHLHTSLEELDLIGWEKLSSVPHQLQHLTSLKLLTIRKFNGVKALPEWLGNLSSLRELAISYCENLKHLPSKEAMQHLSNLKEIRIWECPRLKENSAEHLKISHSMHSDGRDGWKR